MKKTAAFILNYNLPEETDKLFELLKPYERTDYDLFVLENGSAQDKRSKYATHLMDKNLYFGGGFNAAMSIVNQNDKYDSLLFFSNDLKLYPQEFVRTLRGEMFVDGKIKYDIVSPCVFNLNDKIYWPTMFNWGSAGVRPVPMADFQCPLISSRLLKEIKEIPYDLMYGWGIDLYFSLIAEKKNWKIGVVDRLSVIHDDCLTVRKGKVEKMNLNDYHNLATEGEIKFFRNFNLEKERLSLREKAKNYKFGNDYILFNLHIMWYESGMINETLDSIQNALKHVNMPVKFKICLNSQTYIEKPKVGSAEDMFKVFQDHPIMKMAEITRKTDSEPFYNIGDWRRDMYDPMAKYTVWGESDCLLPMTLFEILQNFSKEEKHIVTFASRKMWGDEWLPTEHYDIRKYSEKNDTLKFLPKYLRCNEIIDQKTLDDFNNLHVPSDGLLKAERKDVTCIDGSLVCISGGLTEKFIPDNMHFSREDTCFQDYCYIKKIPQYLFSHVLKGHNYHHPKKRTNTDSTRDSDVYKKYESESKIAMKEFINKLKNEYKN